MKMVKVKTAELEGKALDWAVAKSVGVDCLNIRHTVRNVRVCSAEDTFSPSSEWSQCGPLIDKYRIDLYWHDEYEIEDDTKPMCEASLSEILVTAADAYDPVGETALIAACRAIVSAEFGDEVEVPEVLLK